MVMVVVVERNHNLQFWFIRSWCDSKAYYFLPFFSSATNFQFNPLHFVDKAILNFHWHDTDTHCIWAEIY